MACHSAAYLPLTLPPSPSLPQVCDDGAVYARDCDYEPQAFICQIGNTSTAPSAPSYYVPPAPPPVYPGGYPTPPATPPNPQSPRPYPT